jgi:hypothetical protein
VRILDWFLAFQWHRIAGTTPRHRTSLHGVRISLQAILCNRRRASFNKYRNNHCIPNTSNNYSSSSNNNCNCSNYCSNYTSSTCNHQHPITAVVVVIIISTTVRRTVITITEATAQTLVTMTMMSSSHHQQAMTPVTMPRIRHTREPLVEERPTSNPRATAPSDDVATRRTRIPLIRTRRTRIRTRNSTRAKRPMPRPIRRTIQRPLGPRDVRTSTRAMCAANSPRSRACFGSCPKSACRALVHLVCMAMAVIACIPVRHRLPTIKAPMMAITCSIVNISSSNILPPPPNACRARCFSQTTAPVATATAVTMIKNHTRCHTRFRANSRSTNLPTSLIRRP